jgi:hypothetical protein
MRRVLVVDGWEEGSSLLFGERDDGRRRRHSSRNTRLEEICRRAS